VDRAAPAPTEVVEQRDREIDRQARREAGDEMARITRRQQEVAALVAEGLSNEEIGARLTLEAGTVANHMENILKRLELRNRTSLAVWAVERGLYRSDWGENG
jgi:DNA-binding NarL/FixJ family response regulator